MSYLKAFQRPFQDLKKLTLGAILSGIPVLNVLTGLFVTGYTAECARLTFHQKNNLPEWKNFLETESGGFDFDWIGGGDDDEHEFRFRI